MTKENKLAANRKWKQNNLERAKSSCNAWRKKQYQEDPYMRAVKRAKGTITLYMKNLPRTNSRKYCISKLLGYSFTDFANRFEEDIIMYRAAGVEYNLDHKIPITWFQQGTDPKLIHHLDNLQILSCQENKDKRNNFPSPAKVAYLKLIKPFIKTEYLCW